jgi:hypothetical protein
MIAHLVFMTPRDAILYVQYLGLGVQSLPHDRLRIGVGDAQMYSIYERQQRWVPGQGRRPSLI